MVKRLHDRDRPAWVAALFLAPPLIKGVTDLIGITGNPVNPNVLPVFLLNMSIHHRAFGSLSNLAACAAASEANQHGPDPLGGSDDRR